MILQPALRPVLEPVLRSPFAAGFAFSPTILFASGEQGGWWDPSDFSTMSQDTAGATPAAVGQPVGRILDKSGRGNHRTQTTAASRPTLQDASGFWEDYDGVDDSTSSATGGGATTGFFFCAAVRVDGGAGTVREIWSDEATNAGHVVRLNTGNVFQFAVGTGAGFVNATTGGADPISVGQTRIVTAWHDGTNINSQIDNGTVASTAMAVAAAGTTGFTVGKQNGGSGRFFNGGLGPMVYRHGTVVDAALRERVKRFVASKVGIGL